MVDPAERRIHLAKTALSRHLVTHRQLPFLRRNLNYILDQHELALLRSKRDPDAFKAEMIANERRHAGWDFPTRDMLADLLKGQKPVLNIASIQLRHPASKHDPQAPQATAARQSRVPGDPDWLPDPISDYSLPCHVSVAVTDPRTPNLRIYADLRPAVLRRRINDDDDHPIFDVQLDHPFALELEKLFVVEEVGTNGNRHWKRTTTAKYTLTISIQCQDSDDTADLLNQLEGLPRETYLNAPANEGTLKMVWNDIPECPPAGKLLAISRSKGYKAPKLPYEAEVFMGWKRRRDSALARYNRSFHERQEASWQLPTPSASDDLERPRSKCTIKYMFKERAQYRSTVKEGLDCLFCRDDGEHSSFERLHLHYLTHHDHFKYEVEHDVGEATKTVWVLLDNNTKLQNEKETQKEREFAWLAPRRPFDVTGFVNGEDLWTVAGPSVLHKPKPGARKGKQRREPEADHSPTRPRERRKRLPPEVKDLPLPQRKRNPVPYVPGVRFYRTISKQLVEPGIVISDSDDDIDDRWLDQSQRRDLAALGLDDVARSFHELFNRHLDLERPSSDLFLPDALIRFARQFQSILQSPNWYAAFRAKLDQLRRHGVVDADTVAYCLTHTAPPSSENEVPAARSTRSGTDSRIVTRSPAPSDHDSGPVIEESPEAARATAERLDASLSPSVLGANSNHSDVPLKKRRNRWRDGRMDFGGGGGGSGSGDRHHHQPLPPPPSLPPFPYVPKSRSSSSAPESDAIISETPPKSRSSRFCVCGEAVTRPRDAIGCANPDCGRDFHLACVGLDRGRREPGWRCGHCVAAASGAAS